jgi:hypothetical protein
MVPVERHEGGALDKHNIPSKAWLADSVVHFGTVTLFPSFYPRLTSPTTPGKRFGHLNQRVRHAEPRKRKKE